MKITLAFAIYNREKYIESILDSWISNLSGQNPCELIMVFDACKDKSEEVARSYVEKHPIDHKFFQADNKYEIFCNNLALEHATGDYIIFIQGDNWIYNKNWDITLTEVISKIENLGMIGLLAGVETNPNFTWNRIEIDRPHKKEAFAMHKIPVNYELAVWQVDIVMRPFCISTELLRSKGGLDLIFLPQDGDHTDLSLKLLQEGRTNIYIPFDLVNTDGGEISTDWDFLGKKYALHKKIWDERYGEFMRTRKTSSLKKLFELKEENGKVKITSDKIKLCLGVNRSMKEIGWISVDVQGKPDILDSAKTLQKIQPNSCEQIIASHILEHLEYAGYGEQRIIQTVQVLKIWRSKLIPGGNIFIAVPDADKMANIITAYPDSYWTNKNPSGIDIVGPLFGGDHGSGDFHSMLYNFLTLKYCLEQAGFKNIYKMENSAYFLPEYNASAGDAISIHIYAENPMEGKN